MSLDRRHFSNKSSSILERRLAQFSGILSVGIGDSVASIIGSKMGTRKWPGTKRTLEGSIAGLIAQFMFIACLWYFGTVEKRIFFARITNCFSSVDMIPYSQRNLFFISLGFIFTTQTEAFSRDIDNLTLPISLFPFLYACKT